MNLVVLDDEKAFIDEFVDILARIRPNDRIEGFDNEQDFFEYTGRQRNRIHCIFMDIRLNDKSGIDIAKHANDIQADVPVVFVTGYPKEYCQSIFLEHFEFEPFAFVCKPVDEKVLEKVFEKLESRYREKGSVISLRTGRKETILSTSEITYIESNRWYVTVHTTQGEMRVRSKLCDIEKLLPESFAAAHKSFIINADCVQSFDTVSVTLRSGETLPVSRSRKNEFRKKVLAVKGFEKC